MLRPMININGETAESHVRKRLDTIQALRVALESMLELRPHGRDYMGDTERYERDLAYHNVRFNTLYNLKTDIEVEALFIREGGHE